MIKMMFERNKQYFIITIDNKRVLYWDKLQGAVWGTSLQYLPPDPSMSKKIIMSRNKIPANFIELLKVTPEELAEFNNAKDDEELKVIVLRDCKKHGINLVEEMK